MINLDGVRMKVVKTAESGVVDRETVFTFRQADDLVSAHYAGGGVALGYLVGRIDGDRLVFRYCQADLSSGLDGGRSDCRLERLDDGRLRLIERFEWTSRAGAGENVFEQVSDN